jgi:purine-binding chemotaxis protein CheW
VVPEPARANSPPHIDVADVKYDDGNPKQLISFGIGDEQYGVDIVAVREIKGWTAVTPLPHQPQYMRGVLNLRGVVVPIVDLRCRFGQGLTETTPLHIVIVVQIGGRLIGLLGDRVLDIVPVKADQIQPVPYAAQGHGCDCLSGILTVDDCMIALVKLSAVLSQEDNEQSQQLNG